MGKRILIVVLLLVLAVFAYMGYSSYGANRAGANGDVYSLDPSPGHDHAKRAERVLDGPAEAGASVHQPDAGPASGTQTTPTSPDEMQQKRPAAPGVPPSSDAGASADTISPNPPNGVLFSGTGHFQLYRQGNLTWRVNTDTGQSCVLFATDTEWKKSRVYRAGCRGR